MNKSDLIDQLAEQKEIPRATAERIVQELFAAMADALITGDRIEVRGFGSFELREYEGYVGRNPKTGLEVHVKAKKSPFFKVGKELKERVMAAGS
jgi:integration host factor subunit beta